MTRNQIDYWRLQEEKRHAKTQERETERANRAESKDRRLSSMLDRAVRSQQNVINSEHYLRMDTETKRHNVEQERLQALAHQNELARITLGYDQMANSKDIAQINAGVGYAGVGAQYANIAEMSRANQAREAQLAAQLLEQERHSRAQEQLDVQKVGQQRLQTLNVTRQQNLAEEQWRKTGYNQAIANIINTSSLTLLNEARTKLTETQNELAPIETSIRSATSVLNSLDSFQQRYGGKKSGKQTIPKGSVQWPDGSITTPKR